MLEDYKEKQPLFYNYVTKILKDKKIGHAYLIETNGVNYGFDLALALSKSFLCKEQKTKKKNCNQCTICSTIDVLNYPDLKIIETDTKVIKKEQLLELQHEFSTKALYGNYKIYIIKDANLLNKSSANTILKFLEEPSDNIIAILLTDNIYNCIDTIVSRCQILTLTKEEELNRNTFKKYCPGDTSLEVYIKEEISNIINYYKLLEEEKFDFFLNKEIYIYKDKIDLLLQIGLLIYMDLLKNNLNLDYKKNLEDYSTIQFEKIDVNDIIRKIDVINHFLEKSNFNVNRELFIDNFVIKFIGGVLWRQK